MKKEKTEKVKKPLLKRWWFWVLLLLLIGAVASPKPDGTTKPVSETTQIVEPTATETAVQKEPAPSAEPTNNEAGEAAQETEAFRVLLSWDETGAYGEQRIINENTDSPMTYIAFSLPAGTYEVKNLNSKGGSQVTVYSGVEFDGQWEQFVSKDCDNPIVVMGGEEAKEITIKDGQFVKLSDNSTNIEFVLKQ